MNEIQARPDEQFVAFVAELRGRRRVCPPDDPLGVMTNTASVAFSASSRYCCSLGASSCSASTRES